VLIRSGDETSRRIEDTTSVYRDGGGYARHLSDEQQQPGDGYSRHLGRHDDDGLYVSPVQLRPARFDATSPMSTNRGRFGRGLSTLLTGRRETTNCTADDV